MEGEGLASSYYKNMLLSNKDKLLRTSLYPGEDNFFKNNPNVAGMKTEDKKVILNPYSKLSPKELDAVYINEATRINLDNYSDKPQFTLTDEQKEFFKDTAYGKNEAAAKDTVVARILSNDPSVKTPTKEQQDYVNKFLESQINAGRF